MTCTRSSVRVQKHIRIILGVHKEQKYAESYSQSALHATLQTKKRPRLLILSAVYRCFHEILLLK